MDEHIQLSIIIVMLIKFSSKWTSIFFQLDLFGSDEIHQTLDVPLIRMLLFCCLLAEPTSLSQICQELSQSKPALSQLCQELSQSNPARSQLCQKLPQSRPALSQLCQELSQSRPALGPALSRIAQNRATLGALMSRVTT